MKKITELVKPFLAIIFGTLLFLVYLNYLKYTGANLAMGIIGVIIAAYYLTIGVLVICLGDKLGKARKGLDLASASLYPLFYFVTELLSVIDAATNDAAALGPTGWTIAIISMLASIVLVFALLVNFFAPSSALKKMAQLFAAVFALALVLDIAFGFYGVPAGLGDVTIVVLVLYFAFGNILFSYVTKESEATPKVEDAPIEEAPAVEEKAEEKPAEEEPKTEDPKEE